MEDSCIEIIDPLCLLDQNAMRTLVGEEVFVFCGSRCRASNQLQAPATIPRVMSLVFTQHDGRPWNETSPMGPSEYKFCNDAKNKRGI